MKEKRTEAIVEELRTTVEKLNRLKAILAKMDVEFSLLQTTKSDDFELSDIIQKVKY